MTSHAPPRFSIKSIAIGSVLTGLALLSTWFIAGRNWIAVSAQNEHQTAVNTLRLDRLEDEQRQSITKIEHEELIRRIERLEALHMREE